MSDIEKALRWYVENDDVNECDPDNAFWIDGRRRALEALERHVTQQTDIASENERLRVMLANSDADCPYCGLKRVDWLKCPSGFPGCARMDDAMSNPEWGADITPNLGLVKLEQDGER